jgi:hypothetical protein
MPVPVSGFGFASVFVRRFFFSERDVNVRCHECLYRKSGFGLAFVRGTGRFKARKSNLMKMFRGKYGNLTVMTSEGAAMGYMGCTSYYREVLT